MFRMIWRYALVRLQEPTIVHRLILFVGGSWAAANPDQANAIVPIVIAVAYFVGILMPDARAPAPTVPPGVGSTATAMLSVVAPTFTPAPQAGFGDRGDPEPEVIPASIAGLVAPAPSSPGRSNIIPSPVVRPVVSPGAAPSAPVKSVAVAPGEERPMRYPERHEPEQPGEFFSGWGDK